MLDAARRLMAPSARSDVPAFMVMDVMAAAARIEAAGGRVIHMEVGQPAAPAPATAIAAARAALVSGRLGYTETLGIPTLRARIARHYQEAYGIAIDPARVIVTTGSSAAFILAFLALFEPGDRVAIALPGYPPYRHILTALGCEPVAIETTRATRWAITPEMLLDGASQGAAQGRADRKSRQPDRHHDDGRGAARSRRRRGRCRDQLHLRRDLSRPRLCICAPRPPRACPTTP